MLNGCHLMSVRTSCTDFTARLVDVAPRRAGGGTAAAAPAAQRRVPMMLAALVLGTAVSAASAGPTTLIAPSATGYQYIGRFQHEGETSKFDMPGTEIRASLVLSAASKVSVKLAQKHHPHDVKGSGNTKNSGFQENAVVVWIDGERQGPGGSNATFTTTKDQTEAPVSFPLTTGGAALPAGTHNIRIFKATEADWNGGSPAPNYLTFYGIESTALDSAAAAAAVLAPPPPLPTRKIEFLGDSITAGFCNMCETQAADPHSPADHSEAYDATWDYQIGELLGAQVHTAAWSGLGMYTNCCGGNTTMPSIFSRTLATVNVDNTWKWSSWVPDALVINLGTNDGGNSLKPQYTEIYTKLVMEASKNYGPNLNVFMACGPMSEVYCKPIEQVIQTVKAHGVKAHFLDQRGFLNGTFGPACCGHPSIEVDTAMAKSGAAFIKQTLGW